MGFTTSVQWKPSDLDWSEEFYYGRRMSKYPMRVLFLVSSLPIRKIGGTEIMTLRICERLAMLGHHEPFIFTVPQSTAEFSEESILSCFSQYDIKHIPPENVRFSERINNDQFLSYSRATMSYARGLKHLIKEIRPDVMVSMKVQPPDLLSRTLSTLSKRTGIPYVFMIRGFTDLLDAPRNSGYAVDLSTAERIKNYFYYKLYLPKFVRSASQIVAQTEAQKDYLMEKYSRSAHVLFNPVDAMVIQSTLDRAGKNDLNQEDEIKDERNNNSEAQKRPIKIVYAGTVWPRKNVITLLKAVDLLIKERLSQGKITGEYNDVSLSIVGGSPGIDMIRKLVEQMGLTSKVIFKGIIPPERLWPFMAGCDLFAFPTLSEGFPNVLLEAMACSLPIVSSDFPGVKDVLRSDMNGLIFRRKDSRELADKISYFMEHDDYRKRVGRFNKEFVKQFNWDTFMDRFERIIESGKENRNNELS